MDDAISRAIRAHLSRRDFLVRSGQASLGAAAFATFLGARGTLAQDPTMPSGAGKKVALMATQKAGDKGPVDNMVEALERAKTDFGVETQFIEATDPSAYEGILRNLAQSGTNIIAATFNEVAEPFKALAPEFPDTIFIQIFGDPIDPAVPNITTVSYDYYLGCYLSGILCANASVTKKLGYIGGISIPPLNADFNAYTAAAQSVDPAITTTAAFAGSFEDPVKGRELAAAQYADGVDFIQTDAAATDLGIVEAAKEKNGFVIAGAEAIFEQGPANIPGIVILRFGDSLYNQIWWALDPAYTGGHINSGLNDGIVDLVISDRFIAEGPAEMVAAVQAAIPAVDATRQGIVDGSIVVEFNPNLAA